MGSLQGLPILIAAGGDRVKTAMPTLIPSRPNRRPQAAVAALAAVLAIAAAVPVRAQQSAAMEHLAPQAMSASDRASVESHRNEIIEGAEIYGYNLVAGDWTYRQTLCAPLPQTILLHYREHFPDGTESLFTALVPRGQGRVRIVPVLHRNATPFVPAPRNPSNYALFNSLVPTDIASKELTSGRNWIELSACYAEMTGADIEIPRGESIQAGAAGAPTATINIDAQHKSSLVTFADRETADTFRVWSISFNHAGRVTAAGTEVYPINPSKAPATSSVEEAQLPETPERAPANEGTPASQNAKPSRESLAPHPPIKTVAAEKESVPAAAESQAETQASTPPTASQPTTEAQSAEPGWKFIPQAPQPPSKFVPTAPQPPSKIVPQPPNL
jgi:hypothetical protein